MLFPIHCEECDALASIEVKDDGSITVVQCDCPKEEEENNG